MNKFCGNCGAPLVDGMRFCGSCGANTQPAATTPDPTPAPAFSATPAFNATPDYSATPAPVESTYTPLPSNPVPAEPVYTAPPVVPVPSVAPVETSYSAPRSTPDFQPLPGSETATPGSGGPGAPPPFSATPAATASGSTPPPSSTPWVKILIVLVVIFVACGAFAVGVVIYVGHKVSQKAHEYSARILSESQADENAHPQSLAARVSAVEASKDADASGSTAITGDVCALLSKDDVTHAIGIPIVSTKAADGGCSYFAVGTGADMASKHASAMMGAKGADKKTQGMFEQFAGGVLKDAATKGANEDTQTPDGTVVVFNFSVDPHTAQEQMDMNRKIFGGLGGAATAQDIPGIGDEAFVAADSMMLVRKGQKLIKIMFMTCPCGTEAIKPLAKELAAKL